MTHNYKTTTAPNKLKLADDKLKLQINGQPIESDRQGKNSVVLFHI